jgi:hypothetical protein
LSVDWLSITEQYIKIILGLKKKEGIYLLRYTPIMLESDALLKEYCLFYSIIEKVFI